MPWRTFALHTLCNGFHGYWDVLDILEQDLEGNLRLVLQCIVHLCLALLPNIVKVFVTVCSLGVSDYFDLLAVVQVSVFYAYSSTKLLSA